MFLQIEEMPYNEEYYGLLHSIHSKKVGKYLGRGYTILPKKEGAVLRETEVRKVSVQPHKSRRPMNNLLIAVRLKDGDPL